MYMFSVVFFVVVLAIRTIYRKSFIHICICSSFDMSSVQSWLLRFTMRECKRAIEMMQPSTEMIFTNCFFVMIFILSCVTNSTLTKTSKLFSFVLIKMNQKCLSMRRMTFDEICDLLVTCRRNMIWLDSNRILFVGEIECTSCWLPSLIANSYAVFPSSSVVWTFASCLMRMSAVFTPSE